MTEIPPPLGDDDMKTEGLPDDQDNPMLGRRRGQLRRRRHRR